MAMQFEDLRVLQAAEEVADAVWHEVVHWKPLAQDVVGKQLARAADSIGANIAEAFGRFHYGEKLQFLYYARGSIFETKYWLNRSLARELMPSDRVQSYVSQLTDLTRQLNAFANALKAQRHSAHQQAKAVREAPAEYITAIPLPLFTDEELEWLNNIEYPISNI